MVYAMRSKTSLILALLFWLPLSLLSAITLPDAAGVLAEGRPTAWREQFTEDLSMLNGGARISSAAYELTVRAFSGQPLPNSPQEAAQRVFALLLETDRGLRTGRPPAQVFLEAKRAAALAGLTSRFLITRPGAREQLRGQLANMGAKILGELEDRPGPQSGPGPSVRAEGAGSKSGSGRARSFLSGADRGSGTLEQ